MKLPLDFARCDGLLPKETNLNGKMVLLWSIDCPKREQCARYCQLIERDFDINPGTLHQVTTHFHKPTETCPDFIQEKN